MVWDRVRAIVIRSDLVCQTLPQRCRWNLRPKLVGEARAPLDVAVKFLLMVSVISKRRVDLAESQIGELASQLHGEGAQVNRASWMIEACVMQLARPLMRRSGNGRKVDWKAGCVERRPSGLGRGGSKRAVR